MRAPTPQLPDRVLLNAITIPIRLRNALIRAGLRTVGDVRRADDSFIFLRHHIGRASLLYLRENLGIKNDAQRRQRQETEKNDSRLGTD